MARKLYPQSDIINLVNRENPHTARNIIQAMRVGYRQLKDGNVKFERSPILTESVDWIYGERGKVYFTYSGLLKARAELKRRGLL